MFGDSELFLFEEYLFSDFDFEKLSQIPKTFHLNITIVNTY